MSTFDRKFEYVLQAIEHLRHRKARPDLEGIKSYAFRRFGIDPVTCTTDVEELIQTEHIIRVEFKGRTSYRNAAKYFQQDAPVLNERSPSTPSRDVSPEPAPHTSAVSTAIAAILCDQPTPPSETGAVSLRSITSYLQSRHHGRYSRKYIDSVIEKEIAACNITSNGKDTFTLPAAVLKQLDRRWKHERVKIKREPIGDTSGEMNKQNKMIIKKKEKSPPPTPPRPERVGQRMKRAKKVFDPSDIVEVPRKRGRPVGTSKKNRELRLSNNFATTPERSKSPYSINVPSPSAHHLSSDLSRCILCKYYTVIVNGVTSKMLVCSECNKNVHAKCLGFDQEVLPRVPESEWKCPDCRPCSVCKLVQDQDTLLLCCECDTTFHRTCLNTVIESADNEQQWVCDVCRSNHSAEPTPSGKIQDIPEESKSTITTPSFPSVPNLGPWIFGTRQLELKGPPFQLNQTPVPDPSIPDAAVWTPQDVQDYFSKIGFEEQAALLRQHEIDGASLLLMKRNDVVRNMGLKLGPAVKIYNHIRRLQTRRDDLIYA